MQSDLECLIICGFYLSYLWYRALWQVEWIDSLVSPVALVHSIVSVVVFAVLELTIGLSITNFHGQTPLCTLLLHLANFSIEWKYLRILGDISGKQTHLSGTLVHSPTTFSSFGQFCEACCRRCIRLVFVRNPSST